MSCNSKHGIIAIAVVAVAVAVVVVVAQAVIRECTMLLILLALLEPCLDTQEGVQNLAREDASVSRVTLLAARNAASTVQLLLST